MKAQAYNLSTTEIEVQELEASLGYIVRSYPKIIIINKLSIFTSKINQIQMLHYTQKSTQKWIKALKIHKT